MTRSVRQPALGSRASLNPVMIAAASTGILPSFYTAPGEYSTLQMVGEEIANIKYAADALMAAFVITNCTKLAGAPITGAVSNSAYQLTRSYAPWTQLR
jgi:hypothetical protein